MGTLISTQRAAARARAKKARSDIIDKRIQEDRRKFMRTCSMLILGTKESGKSTFLKQLKMSYGSGFSTSELGDLRLPVYRNVLESAQALVTFMHNSGLECIESENRTHSDRILEYRPDDGSGSSSALFLSPEVMNAIIQVWEDPLIPTIVNEHLHKFDHLGNAEYFLNRVKEIGTSKYIPTETDALWVYQKSIELTEIEISYGQLSMKIIDIGHPDIIARRKFIHCFEQMTSIIFCVALSDYDYVLPIPKRQTRLHNALEQFDFVVTSRWFRCPSIILYLNKIDVLKKKLPKSPLECHFPEYTGGNDINKGAKFLLWSFMSKNTRRLRIYPHLQAMNTMGRTDVHVFFTAVKETILQNALEDRNIL